MSVGLLIIAHNQVGGALLEAASRIFESCPLPVDVLPVCSDSDFDGLVKQSQACVQALDVGQGVLVLTDLFGSTPSNIATTLISEAANTIVIAGVNLPMLIRIFNYSHLELDALADAACQGGENGIVSFDADGVTVCSKKKS